MNDLNFDANSDSGSAISEVSEPALDTDFSIPDEYSQKSWSKLFDGKTGDELKQEFFRSYDDLQNNLSLKVSDFLVSNDLKQLENYDEIKKSLVSQLMPEYDIPSDVNDYELDSVLSNEEGQKFFAPQEALELFGEKFKELGLSVKQGQELLKNYLDYEVREFQKYTDAEELEKNISGMFAQNPVQRSTVESLIREFLPPEDQKFLQDTMPNCVIEMFYKVYKANGAAECKKALLLMKVGRLPEDFIEGMACEGGCVGGPSSFKDQMLARKSRDALIKKADDRGIYSNLSNYDEESFSMHR